MLQNAEGQLKDGTSHDNRFSRDCIARYFREGSTGWGKSKGDGARLSRYPVTSPLKRTSDKIVEALLQGHDWPESFSEGKAFG